MIKYKGYAKWSLLNKIVEKYHPDGFSVEKICAENNYDDIILCALI